MKSLLFAGIGGMALFMVTFVICVEYVGVKYTMFTGIVIEIPFALGELILGLEAYLVRDWITLQLVAHLPIFALLGLYFLVPESPRWLIAVGRTEEAKVIIQKGAEINGRTLPDSIFAVIILNFISGECIESSLDLCSKCPELFQTKVRKSQNEFMASSFEPKTERKCFCIFALKLGQMKKLRLIITLDDT